MVCRVDGTLVVSNVDVLNSSLFALSKHPGGYVRSQNHLLPMFYSLAFHNYRFVRTVAGVLKRSGFKEVV